MIRGLLRRVLGLRPHRAVASWLARSIEHRIAVAGAALAATFVIGTGVASYAATRAFFVGGIRAGLNGQATIVANGLLDAFRAVQTDVGELSRSSLVENALAEPDRCSEYLEPFLREHALPVPVWHRLGLTDAAGRVVASNVDLGPRGYGDRPWWRSLLRGEPHAEVTRGEAPTLLLAYPVRRPAKSTPEGALVLELPLGAVFAHVVPGLQRGDVAVLTRDGGELASMAGEEAGPAEPRIEATIELGSRPWVPVAGLAVSVATPRERALEPLGHLTRVYAGGGVVALLLAAIVARLSSRVVTRRIRALSAAAERVARERTTDARFEADGEDEPAQLARALQLMVDALRTAHDTLEARVTERTAELELARTQMRSILDNMADGLVTADVDGRIESFNRSAERLFGWSAAEAIGRDVGILMAAPHRGAHRTYLRRCSSTLEPRLLGVARELQGVRRDGTVFPIELVLSEFAYGASRTHVALIRDITERQKVDRMKDEFVSVVSHELRTPLTSIRGALGLLAGGATGALSEEAAGLVRIALENGVRLGRLIDELLDVQRIEAGRFTFELQHVPLAELVRKAIDLNEAFARERSASIVLASELPDVAVSVDDTRFQQIMSNLLSNAAKYSPPGGCIEVRAAPSGDASVRIEVTDHGPGIPASFRRRVFEKFSQADASSTRAREGTGLGLAITKALVERMGGAIGFTTEEGRGTTFFIEFPASDRGRQTAA